MVHVNIKKKKERESHKAIPDKATSKVLQILHMDLIRPMQVEILAGKKYAFVCVDDFFRYVLYILSSIAIGVNVQMHTISNKVMSIQYCLHRD